MNDSPASSFALGFLAAKSTVDFATDVAMTITHGRRQPQIDMNALIAENHALRTACAELEADNARLQRNVDKLQAWGNELYAELVQIKGR